MRLHMYGSVTMLLTCSISGSRSVCVSASSSGLQVLARMCLAAYSARFRSLA